jgi:hypothetical protein
MIYQPQVKMAIERLKFISGHPYKFDNNIVARYISFLKLIELIFTEVVTIIVQSTFDNIEDIVVNQMALVFISEIDNIYYYGIQHKLKDKL